MSQTDNSNNNLDNSNNMAININDLPQLSDDNTNDDLSEQTFNNDDISIAFDLNNYKQQNNNYNIVNKGDWNNNNNADDLTDCSIRTVGFINKNPQQNKIIGDDSLFHSKSETKLYDTISTNTADWFTYLSVVQYEYNFFQSLNTTTSVIIILLSSSITLLEGLKSTTNLPIHYDLISLILSFLIALIASLVKFFNFQFRMEILKTILDNLDSSYVEGNELFNKYIIFLTKGNNHPRDFVDYDQTKKDELLKLYNKSFSVYWEDWERISSNTVRPLSNVSKLIDPQVLVIYKDRFFKQQELEDNISNQNKFFNKINKNYLKEMEMKEINGERFRDINAAKIYNNYRYIMRNYLEESKMPKSKVKKNLKYFVRLIFG